MQRPWGRVVLCPGRLAAAGSAGEVGVVRWVPDAFLTPSTVWGSCCPEGNRCHDEASSRLGDGRRTGPRRHPWVWNLSRDTQLEPCLSAVLSQTSGLHGHHVLVAAPSSVGHGRLGDTRLHVRLHRLHVTTGGSVPVLSAARDTGSTWLSGFSQVPGRGAARS